MQPLEPSPQPPERGLFGWLHSGREVLQRRLPVISRAVVIGARAEIVDRAAAMALFCMLAAVPALLGAFSAAGFVLGKMDHMAGLAGYEIAREPIIGRLLAIVQQVLPGVTWDPVALTRQLVEDRTENGVYGSVAAILLGLGVFARIDAAIRATLGRKRRSAWRAAGMMTLIFLIMGLLAVLMVVAAPMTHWWANVAEQGVARVSPGWTDWLPAIFAVGQTLPIGIGFYTMVLWSAGSGTIDRRRIAAAALLYSVVWFLGQRAFTLYVAEVIAMNAIYGALTGVLALMLWLYYAAIAFLAVVALLAAWQEVERLRKRV